ncbi:hypothetical protein ACNPP3_001175 [Vibrio vulnificus]|nr:hypothetical protein [Vibrio vulnificus]
MPNEQLCTDEIGELVKKFVHRLLDVDATIKLFVPKAIEEYNARIDKAEDLYRRFTDYKNANPEQFPEHDFEELTSEEEESNEPNAPVVCDIQEHEAIVAINKASRIYRAVGNSDIVATLSQAMFLNLYSILDAYTGELLETLYRLKPELYGQLNKSVPFEVIMKAENIDIVKKKILDDDIESFRRESYIEQFKSLEKRFGLNTLTKFSYWRAFVEYSQKRNIIMHCDGIVSEQYITVCKSVGIKEASLPKVGEQLELSDTDVLVASHIIGQTGIMLAYTLWSKLFPRDKKNLDDSIHSLCYDFLYEEQWHHAAGIGEFIEKSLKTKDDATSKMNTINLCIAYKALDKQDQLNKTIKSVDWSLLTLDFRLAESVLLGKFDQAALYMKKIGVEGDFVKRSSYHEWPLFHKFRDSPEFIDAYKDVYQESYLPSEIIDIEEVEKLDNLVEIDKDKNVLEEVLN